MNTSALLSILENPEQLTAAQTSELAEIVAEFPFFQPVRAVFLKGLKNQGSFNYNKELKRTAALTTDRSILFDFITSPVFTQNAISKTIKEQEESLYNIVVNEAKDVSEQVETEELGKANQVLDPDFFIPKTDNQPEKTDFLEPEKLLEIGVPLDFGQKETHSFAEWLQITTHKPIDRTQETEDTSETIENDEETDEDLERKRKLRIIDRFIANNPKIKVKPVDETVKRNVIEEVNVPDEALMTETLARVYVEQKNFNKAKQAYRILSLKYPEKSGFFADRIRAIEKLQDNKNT